MQNTRPPQFLSVTNPAEPSVLDLITALDSRTDSLRASVSELAQKLQPILRPTAEKPTPPSTPTTPSCAIADSLRCLIDKVEAIERTTSELHRAVQL